MALSVTDTYLNPDDTPEQRFERMRALAQGFVDFLCHNPEEAPDAVWAVTWDEEGPYGISYSGIRREIPREQWHLHKRPDKTG